jgi:hypothetical protein
LVAVLKNLVCVRNIVADHFLRMTNHSQLLNLGHDISKLAIFKSKDGRMESAIFNNLSALAKLEDRIGSKSVNNMDRFAYIISLLNEVEHIKKSKIEEDSLTLFSICMRYVVAGTAARELDRQNLIPADMKEAGDLFVRFGSLNDLRVKFAHCNAVYKDDAYLKTQIMNFNDGECIAALTSKIPVMCSVLQKHCVPRSLAISVVDEEVSSPEENENSPFAFRPVSSAHS